MDSFKRTLDDRDLLALGFTRDVLTWRNHHHHSEDYIKERLDPAVANGGWRARFPCVAVHNGVPYHSDHRLVIIMTEKSDRRRRAVGEKQFAFEASWLLEDHC